MLTRAGCITDTKITVAYVNKLNERKENSEAHINTTDVNQMIVGISISTPDRASPFGIQIPPQFSSTSQREI